MNKRRSVWKVVDKKTRTSVVVKKGKYSIKYEKNKISEAREETLGIFCFKTKRRAKYAIMHNRFFYNGIVLKVKPIGKGSCPNKIANLNYFKENNKKLASFYRNCLLPNNNKPLSETICYPAVNVLE